MQMAGSTERIKMLPLNADDGAELRAQFERFSIGLTRCAKPEDKVRMLTAIQSAFGSHGAFDSLMRSLLLSSLPASPASMILS